jgi:Methyl-accepting chemotaxis protein
MEERNNRLDRRLLIVLAVTVTILLTITAVVFQNRHASRVQSEFEGKLIQAAETLQEMWAFNAEAFVKSHAELNDTSRTLLMMIHYNPSVAQRPGSTAETILPKGYEVRQITQNFRNIRNKPADNEEENLLAKLQQRMIENRMRGLPETELRREVAIWSETKINGQEGIRYTQPIIVKKACLTCHGDKANAPEYVQKNYETGYGYKVGDLRGAVSIIVPAKEFRESRLYDTLLIVLTVLLSGVGIVGLLFLTVKRTIVDPIREIANTASRVAQGDLSERLLYDKPDELGEITAYFNTLVNSVKDTVREIVDLTMKLNQ